MIKKQETQEVIREKIIKIYSLDKRYRRSPYPSVPAEDVQNGTFVTGQHFEPGREGYYLTVEEMRGQKDLTAAKQKAFPYVIFTIAITRVPNMKTSLSSDIYFGQRGWKILVFLFPISVNR